MASHYDPESWSADEFALPVFDQISDQITVIDTEYRCRFANRAVCQQLQTHSQLLGLHVADCLGQEAFGRFKASYDRGLAGETHVWSDWLWSKDGEQMFFECRTMPYRGDCGSILGVINIVRDLTAQVQSEEVLKRGEQRFKDFAEIASDWLWEMDADLRYTWFSPNVEEKTGVPAEWHYGKTREEIASPEIDRAALSEHLAVLQAHEPYKDFVVVRRGPDGDRWVKSSGKPIFDNSGRFVGYRGTGTDITSQVRAEQAAARQEELEAALNEQRKISSLQSSFVSMASHEFRTPLAIIDSAARRLEKRIATMSPEKILDCVRSIRSSVTRMTSLMESMLAAAKTGDGKINILPVEVDVRALLLSCCMQQQELSASHQIIVSHEALPDKMIADPNSLTLIFTNLLSNAVKYSPQANRIDVDGRQNRDHVIISVRDYGVGIDEDDQKELFNRFFRARTAAGIAGTGIGLNLVKMLVDGHGGSVSVTSSRGEGSEFAIRLPLDARFDETNAVS